MSRMCEEELQLMADKCHSLQAKCQMLKEDVAWYKDQLAKYVVAQQLICTDSAPSRHSTTGLSWAELAKVGQSWLWPQLAN